jgi:RNA polymerase sigma factor (TIGR02999 family)
VGPLADPATLQMIYDELRHLAGAMLRSQRPGHTLQPTALVNEAFVRLLSRTSMKTDDRCSFIALAATVMRRVLVDHAREKSALKRGGGDEAMALMALNADATPAPVRGFDVLGLDGALSSLAQLDERKARLVEMRVFAGMSLDEAAEALNIARSTAALDWRFARAWLIDALGEEQGA